MARNMTPAERAEMRMKGLLRFPRADGRPVCDRRAVHLKGFAKGIDWADPRNRACLERCRERLLKHFDGGPCAVVIDGDNWAEDSYVVMLKHLTPGSIVYAFKKTSEVPGFEASYRDVELPGAVIEVVRVSDADVPTWDALGKCALDRTGAATVFTLGGGATVLKEYRQAPDGVQFHVFPVSRTRDGVDAPETSALTPETAPAAIFEAE